MLTGAPACRRGGRRASISAVFTPVAALLLTVVEPTLPDVPVAGDGERARRERLERAPDAASRLELACLLVLEGIDGDADAVRRALPILEAAAPGGEPRALAYLGVARLLEAKRSRWFWEKGAKAREGVGLLDRAVGLAPEDVEIRFLRGRSTLPLPRVFGRRDLAAADLAWVAPRGEAALPRDVAAAAWFYDGLCREEDGDRENARRSFEQALRLDPEGAHGRAAAQRLPR